jgi:hypothetical protein
MKKFLEEVFKYFWIPLILALVSYIFFQLKDMVLGIIVLVGLSAIYTLVRLYFVHKKWWLLIILIVVVFASGGIYFLRAPAITLTVNDQEVTGTSVSVNGGLVTINPAPQSNGLYIKGTVVTLTVAPSAGYDWKDWTGTDDNAVNPTTVTMNVDKKVQVNFHTRFTLVINNQMVIGSFVSFNEGSVTVSPPPDGDGKYSDGTVVTLTARTDAGYDWKGWLSTSNDNANPTQIMMSGNKNVTVDFGQRFSLTVGNQLVIGPVVSFPEGSVTINPAPDDDGKYAIGTQITLTANPETGYGWKSWTGTGKDTTNPVTITINSDKHVAVSFQMRFLLSINNQPVTGASIDFGGGSVAANPAPGDDGRYTKDTITMLTATPSAGYRFDKWSGDVSDKVTSVSITMNTNKSISVTFIKVYNVNTAVSPSGSGAVSPTGGTYDEGSSVTLTATPATGYRFIKWSGDVSDTVTPLVIPINADKNITANFIKVYTLTTSASPAEGGSVSPADGTYDEGSTVTLNAVPAAGYIFEKWSGDVSGNVTPATLTMDGNKNVIASFSVSP